jgi:hypothetical protein
MLHMKWYTVDKKIAIDKVTAIFFAIIFVNRKIIG